jgi:oligopeptide/dipeptide ABC transporter ATP-binding protein
LVNGVCDEVTVMYAGRVVEAGPVEAVFRAPRHPYTRALLHARPAGATRGQPLPAIPGNVPALGAAPDGCAFAPRCPRVQPRCSQAVPALGEVAVGAACFNPEPADSP